MVKTFFGRIIVLLLLSMNASVYADTPNSTVLITPPQPKWAELSLVQRQTLSPLAKDWDGMENYRRRKWLGIADRFNKMPPEEQQRVQQRMREWAALSPEQRAAVRDQFQEYKHLPPEKKQAVKAQWEVYSSLPQEQKQRLQEEAALSKPSPLPKVGSKAVMPPPITSDNVAGLSVTTPISTATAK